MDFPRAVYEVARKEVLQNVRTKRLLIIGVFLLLVLQLVTLVIPLALGLAKQAPGPDEPAYENLWFHFHLNASLFGGLFAIQLMCIVLTADAVCSEWGNRTIFLLLSKPVSRSAFVLGKYLGAMASIMPTVVLLYSLQYLVMNAVFPGAPSDKEVLGFVQMLLVLILGSAAIGAVALFFSSLTKSNVMALIFTLLSVFLLFPLVGLVGDIEYNVDQFKGAQDGQGPPPDLDPKDWKYDWSHYATPGGTLASAPGLLLPGHGDFQGALSGFIPQVAPQRLELSVLMGFVWTALFVGLSVLRVNRRNFE